LIIYRELKANEFEKFSNKFVKIATPEKSNINVPDTRIFHYQSHPIIHANNSPKEHKHRYMHFRTGHVKPSA
jgi:hypothetical protein